MPSCGTYLKRIKELSRSGTNREQGNSSRFTRRQDLSLSLSGDWLPDIPSCRAIKTSIIHDGMALYMASLWRAISRAKYLIYMYYYYCYITRKAKVMLWRIVMQGRCLIQQPSRRGGASPTGLIYSSCCLRNHDTKFLLFVVVGFLFSVLFNHFRHRTCHLLGSSKTISVFAQSPSASYSSEIQEKNRLRFVPIGEPASCTAATIV